MQGSLLLEGEIMSKLPKNLLPKIKQAVARKANNELLKTHTRLYSVRLTAEYLGISTWTVRELVWKGTLPHVRIGKRILIDVQDLNALIAQQKEDTSGKLV